MSQRVTHAWVRFCGQALGASININFLAHEGSTFVVGHVCQDDGPPLTCVDGTKCRRVSMSFDLRPGDILWN